MATKLIDMLEKCRSQFLYYAEQHRAKKTTEAIRKAIVNEQFASDIAKVLAESGELDITSLETIQDYRFGSLVKGENYAYARGLTINPTHLPAALDAMLKDDFKLLAVFGETNSAKIGFIFEREKRADVPPDFTMHDCAKLLEENRQLRARIDGLLGANNTEVERRRSAERKLREYKAGTPLDQIEKD